MGSDSRTLASGYISMPPVPSSWEIENDLRSTSPDYSVQFLTSGPDGTSASDEQVLRIFANLPSGMLTRPAIVLGFLAHCAVPFTSPSMRHLERASDGISGRGTKTQAQGG
ncbi:hypothetical protein J3458_003311 [Metarhizium acridum]|uniref:uncharacterized protein n=1 Tax=Metarhizium acridum TaxID=92637 RepID=UPI001C6BCA21|nr:hypothetical protein J3458_003311 [Metarhizium acridum]